MSPPNPSVDADVSAWLSAAVVTAVAAPVSPQALLTLPLLLPQPLDEALAAFKMLGLTSSKGWVGRDGLADVEEGAAEEEERTGRLLLLLLLLLLLPEDELSLFSIATDALLLGAGWRGLG